MTQVCTIIFGLTLIYLASTAMLGAYVRMLVVQGILLFIIAIANTNEMNFGGFLFVGIETLVLKAIVIPWFLAKVIRENEMNREAEPYISSFFSLLIMSLIFAFGFLIASWSHDVVEHVVPLEFGVSLSTIMAGLFIIMTRRKLITHVMGYMIIENGIFLLSLSAASEMPFVVSLGVSLDIFMGILLAGLFLTRIRSAFEGGDADSLSTLKD